MPKPPSQDRSWDLPPEAAPLQPVLTAGGGSVFTDPRALLRRLVMSEVLGRPLALRGSRHTVLGARRRPTRRGEE